MKMVIVLALLVHERCLVGESRRSRRFGCDRRMESVSCWLSAEAEDGLLTLKGVRTAAMMHLAMHDALNAIHREYAPYALQTDAPDADPDRRGIAGGLRGRGESVSEAVPRSGSSFSIALLARERRRADSAAVELGKAAAAAVSTAAKATSGTSRRSTAFIRWDPASTRSSASTAARPKASSSARAGRPSSRSRCRAPDQFRVGPPPAIGSPEYAAAFAEVKDVGSFASRTRTADQTHLAMWWKEFVEASHNRLARDLVTSDRLEAAPRGAAVRAAQHEHLRRLRERRSTASSSTTTGARTRRSTGRTRTAIRRPSSMRSGTTCTGTHTRFRRTRPRTARCAAPP